MVEARSDARLLCSSVGTGGQGVGEGEKKKPFPLILMIFPISYQRTGRSDDKEPIKSCRGRRISEMRSAKTETGIPKAKNGGRLAPFIVLSHSLLEAGPRWRLKQHPSQPWFQ